MADAIHTPEIWKTIPFAPGYSASNIGNIRRDVRAANGRRPMPMRKYRDRSGYLYVELVVDGARRKGLVNRLVLMAFAGPPPSPDHQSAHGNGIRDDNRLENLRWATRKENWADKRIHGTVPDCRGERGPMAKLTADQVRAIRAEPRRNGMRAELAAQYGVAKGTINSIRTRNKIWRHIGSDL